jgi:hypothetical protein
MVPPLFEPYGCMVQGSKKRPPLSGKGILPYRDMVYKNIFLVSCAQALSIYQKN